MYKFIYQFLSFQFNSDLILQWEATAGAVKPQESAIASDLVGPLIPHVCGFPVA